MTDINKDYQKLLEFICKIEEVGDLKHLVMYLDDFCQNVFAASPILIFSRVQCSEDDKNYILRENWNRGKEKIYYTDSEYQSLKEMVIKIESKSHMSFEYEAFNYYVLNCGSLKDQVFYLAFKTEQVVADSICTYLNQFLVNTLTKFSKYKEADNLKNLINIDDVTGLFNQRRFISDVDRFIAEYEELKIGFSLVFVDIDHFKQVNDGHGHLVGSKLLVDVAKIIKDTVRETDHCYRYGGDEFVVIVPHSDFSDAKIVGDRILSNIKAETFNVEDGQGISEASEFKLTVSIGIASFPTDAKTSTDVINMADKMMYEAKRSGRGKVCYAADLIDNSKKKSS